MLSKALNGVTNASNDSIPHLIDSVNSESKNYSLSKADLDSLYTELNLLNEQDRKRTERWKQAEGKKYSLSDIDYMDAVNRGDMETAQNMVDEAAENASSRTPQGGFLSTRKYSHVIVIGIDGAEAFIKDADTSLLSGKVARDIEK